MDKNFIIQTIDDVSTVSINRLAAHATLPGKRTYLSGIWDFAYFNSPLDLPETICYHKKIKVPANIQLEGFDIPHYTNTRYPWEAKEAVEQGHAPLQFNPTACYQTVFYSDLSETILHFEGVESAMFLYVNGHFAGYSEDSFAPSEFDIKDFLIKGENLLHVIVVKWCSGSWLEDQDFWRFSGIFRDVYLRPEYPIRDIQINANMHGSLFVQTDNDAINEMELYDGKTLIYRGGLQTTLDGVTLWSAETPYLYRLVIAGMEFKIGFRSISIENGVLKVNGKRIVLLGVNRHEFSGFTGRAVSQSDMLRDIRLMKENNINAVRTSHYPNHPSWYELCDEYGLYVIDECNLETHGTWSYGVADDSPSVPGSLPQWETAVTDRMRSMVHRDKNHPSIILWSLGNESFCGENFRKMKAAALNIDTTRPFHYEGCDHCRSFEDVTDIESQMYTHVNDIKARIASVQKPYILCEYAHAMGNSLGNLDEYVALTEEYERFQGGFIWDWIDQTIIKEGKALYGGDFQDYPNDGDFSANGLLFSDGTPTPKLFQVKKSYQRIQFSLDKNQIIVKNQYVFDDLSGCRLVWKLLKNGAVYQTGEGSTFPMPDTDGEFILITSMLRQGQEIAFEQFELSSYTSEKPDDSGVLTAIDGDESFGVHGRDFSVIFAKKRVKSANAGMIASFRKNGKELFQSGSELNFWRADTSNDRGNHHGKRCGVWRYAGKYTELTDFSWKQEPGRVIINTQLELFTSPVSKAHIAYTVHADGKLDISYHLFPDKSLPEIPVIGFVFTVNNAFEQMRWYGRGPYENYIDRQSGAKFGIYEGSVRENLTSYMTPQESGNRTGIRWARISDGETCLVLEGAPFEFNAQKWTWSEIENARHPFELPPMCKTVISANYRQEGIGGDDTWGAKAMDAYLIPCDRQYFFQFTLYAE